VNNWNIAGRIGKDAVLRATQKGEHVAGFSVAVDQRKGGEKVTLWVDCSLWGTRAEKVAEYLTKGTTVALAGEAGTREHEGKVYMTLNVRELTLLGGGKKDEAGERGGGPVQKRGEQPKPGRGAPPSEDFDRDEIPFVSNRGNW
jgi:single-strand DNA-binding protein